MRDLLRHVVAMLRNIQLVGLHLVLNAALLVAASFWLLIPDEHIWQLILAALSALLILLVFLWLHSGTLAYAASPASPDMRSAFSPRLGRMLWLLLGCFVLFWCMRTVDVSNDSQWQLAGYLYSKAPSWLRPTGGASGYFIALGYILSILYWYVLPSLFLPLITARIVGCSSLRGLRVLLRWKYWLGTAITALVGIWLPSLILGWSPGKTLGQQTTGLVVRLVVAYGIAIAAWLVTAALLGYFVGPGNDDARVKVAGKPAA